MGVNNDNPCPVCKSVKSDYWGNSIFVCRGCENVFNNENNTWKFNGTGKQPEPIDPCDRCDGEEADCLGCQHPREYQERSKG